MLADLGVASGTLAAALAVALLVAGAAGPANAEHGAAVTGVLLATAVVLVAVAWVVRRWRNAGPAELALVVVLAAAVLAAGGFLVWASSAIFYRADILIWSESPFVNDILKLRLGRPLYGPPADLDSFFYTPGSQVLTWALAGAAGTGSSIPAYRIIQLLFTAGAALVATRTAWRIAQLAGITVAVPRALVTAFWAALLFLCATNGKTNPYTWLLHNDALALLVSSVTYALLAEYAVTRQRWLIAALAVAPAAGFLVKQSLGIWAPLIGLWLLLADRPLTWRRVIAYGVTGAACLVLTYAALFTLWGPDFRYWVITAMGNHPISILRAAQHVLEAWIWFAGLIGGGAILVAKGTDARLTGLWLVALGLLGGEAYTSGIAWMLNHMGPGSLLAGAWIGVAIVKLWPRDHEVGLVGRPLHLMRSVVAAAIVILALSGLGTVRNPRSPVREPHQRYADAIEAEFEGMPIDRVLLDAGTWPYLGAGVVMRDRSEAVGELGNNGVGDFTGILGRMRQRYYVRILVRDLDSPELAYDYYLWPRASGIREALRTNYRVVRTIPGVTEGLVSPWLHTISVLEPRPAGDPADPGR
jgi:hypothetical protein